MAEENTRRTKARNALIVLLILLLGWAMYAIILPMCTKPDCIECDEVVRRSELNAKLDELISAVKGVGEKVGKVKGASTYNTTNNYYHCDPDDGDCKKVAAASKKKPAAKKSPAKKQTAKKAEPKPQSKKEVVKEQPKVEKKAEPKPEPKPEPKKEVEKQPEVVKEEVKVAEAPKPAPILAPAPVNNNPEELSCGRKSVILDSNGKVLKGLLTNLKVNEEMSALMPSLSETYVSFGDELDQQMWIDCEPKAPQRFKPCINPIVDGSFVEDDGVRVGIKNQRYAINDAGKVVVDMKLGLGMNQSDAVNFKRLSELEIIQINGKYCAVLPTS